MSDPSESTAPGYMMWCLGFSILFLLDGAMCQLKDLKFLSLPTPPRYISGGSAVSSHPDHRIHPGKLWASAACLNWGCQHQLVKLWGISLTLCQVLHLRQIKSLDFLLLTQIESVTSCWQSCLVFTHNHKEVGFLILSKAGWKHTLPDRIVKLEHFSLAQSSSFSWVNNSQLLMLAFYHFPWVFKWL